MKIHPPTTDTALHERLPAQRSSAQPARAAAGPEDTDTWQAAIDRSPRVSAQRRTIESLFADSNGGSSPASGAVAQRIVHLGEPTMHYFKPNIMQDFGLHAPANYVALFQRLHAADKTFSVVYGAPGSFVPENASIRVPMPILGPVARFGELDETQRRRLAVAVSQLAHEMQHAADYVLDAKNTWTGDGVSAADKYLAIMETELRAWATEAIALIGMNQVDDLITGWRQFNDYGLIHSDSDLAANAVWARIIRYGVSNGHVKQAADDTKGDWRESFKAQPQILVWAKEWAAKVVAHSEPRVERGAPEEFVVGNQEEYDSPRHKGFREGAARVWKVKRDDQFYYYNFESKLYKVAKALATPHPDLASGRWA
jgi:hypothetical protein